MLCEEWDKLAQNPFLAFYQRWPWLAQNTPLLNLWNPSIDIVVDFYCSVFASQTSTSFILLFSLFSRILSTGIHLFTSHRCVYYLLTSVPRTHDVPTKDMHLSHGYDGSTLSPRLSHTILRSLRPIPWQILKPSAFRSPIDGYDLMKTSELTVDYTSCFEMNLQSLDIG